MSWFAKLRPMSDEEFRQRQADILRSAPVPVLWLLGKTGSGKSTIIRTLTGTSTIEVGTGFRPQTKVSRLYDFPSEQAPLLRFLDTRGLGEAGYAAAVELDEFTRSAQLVIVVVRAMDHAIRELTEVLRSIRQSHRDRPVLLVLTCLHDAYPGQQHPAIDPFGSDGTAPAGTIPDNLRRSLDYHREQFGGLVDRLVPIDLTPAEEGFHQPDFGSARLKQAILDLLPAAYRESLRRIDEIQKQLKDLQQRRVAPVILGYSSLAASAAAVPLPWVDIPVVIGMQTRLIYRLAELHQQPIDAATIASASGTLGGRIALRMAVRELLKAIPWAGSTLNAAAAFAYTYASGMAWNWYFLEKRAGHVPTPRQLEQVFQQELNRGTQLWQAGTSTTPAE